MQTLVCGISCSYLFRLAEIEMQICSATASGSTCGGVTGSLSSGSSGSGDDNERNKESVI